ncbi:hypothetical protein AMATHDRAFT_77183 [Amanita thiersii Skay4041]|uniref:FAD/NAD(P)-binding domain-containing protein n=1 Tax=Amanita thiersii Skay4041 TaxID=703135 RepID=A0A2A9NII0_9AGAR|nr:hypothetical protein AMATHDRAFT_77183 [Amanita thiersii Skay4041]
MPIDLYNFPIPPLPTFDILNAVVPTDLDEQKVVYGWLDALSQALTSNKVQNISDLFLEDSWWRDLLVLTWDFRTFRGVPAITTFLQDRIGSTHPRSFKVRKGFVDLQRPAEDLAWISAFFDFETDVGVASGIVRLVPTASGQWKAHVVLTNLEDLKGFPEKIGPLRHPQPNHGSWEEDRRKEAEFAGADPVVLIVGGSQSGLAVGARLKFLDVPTLIIERNGRVGDSWRNRYDTLCLHDPVLHIFYHSNERESFPSTWPTFTPAGKLASWLDGYAEAMELNVWNSSSVTQATQDPITKIWKVTVKRLNGSERLLSVKHIIFATGFASPDANMPKIHGMDQFKGQILHSTQHRRAVDHAGKKVVVIGACTSAHDISQDYYNHGIDVTMYQRSSTHIMSVKSGLAINKLYCDGGPQTEIADRISASFPYFMNTSLAQRGAKALAELDKELLEDLKKRGFRTNPGIQNTGAFLLVWSKASGYYPDVGASRLIADGKIKLKNDSQIKEFTESGILFEDGSQLPADLGDMKDNIRKVCGDEVANKCEPVWGLNDEGEINGVWRYMGVPGLWYMTGSLALCRFHSKHLALQIKAMEEGVFGERYSLKV